ncbi:MAG: urea transporter, partial [Gammaproteobacteria bacterium]|nr:urea transporter [Gammaproteobacteria bacterium]
MTMITAKDIHGFFSSFFRSYADVFFIRSSLGGMAILALTFLNFNSGISGVLAVLSAYLTAILLGYQSHFLRHGFYTYNALLVGLSIGFLFELSPLSLLMISIAGALTLVISLVTADVLYKLFGLQVLSIPFIVVSSLVYLSSASFSNLYVDALYVTPQFYDFNLFPYWLSGYFKSMGAIIFLPNELTGLLLSLLLLLYSRILFLLSLAGFLLGVSLYGLFIGSLEHAAQDISSFNYILIAMALGGIFNIPSIKSYTIALLGVAIATLIASAGQVFWSQYGLPIFTLPFTLITLSFIYLLGLIKYPLRTEAFFGSPEENLDYFISNKGRFIRDEIAISPPFQGTWHCWQGFDDNWTHQGIYKYAYDFLIFDSSQKSYQNQGVLLSDYYCYGKEVTSPVNGRVIQVVNLLPDNSIGSVDSVNYWGNYVLIHDSRGFYVKI